jgi:hypothetical protein
MSIIRVSKRERFVVMDKTGLEDPRLGFRTKGLLAYLLTKPDDWYRQLEKVGPDGKTAVLKALSELEQNGYLTRERRHVDGRYDWIQVLHEVPHNAPKTGALSGLKNNAPKTGALTEDCLTEIGNAPKNEPKPRYVVCDDCGCAVLDRDLEAHTQAHVEEAAS